MKDTIYFKVNDLEKHQHYKDRNPPWIKLYNDIFDDYNFGCLQDASKYHLVAIRLLASRTENKMPYDPDWVSKRINADKPVDLDVILKAGFISKINSLGGAINPLADYKQNAIPETETETETEKRKEKIKKKKSRGASAPEIYTPEFEIFWSIWKREDEKAAAFKKWQDRLKEGVTPEILCQAAKYYNAKMEAEGREITFYKYARTFLFKSWREYMEPHKQLNALDGWVPKEQQEQKGVEDGRS